MKKMYSVIAALMVFSSIFTQNVSAENAESKELKLNENGYLTDNNGMIIIGSNEIIRCVAENRTYLTTAEYSVLEYREEPSEEELKKIGKESMGCTYVLISSDKPYVLRPLEDGTTERAENIMPYVSYEFDGINHELKDAKTGNVITRFEVPEEIDTDGQDPEIKYPALGCFWRAFVYYNETKKCTEYQLSETVYHGSTETGLYLVNNEEIGLEGEILTGDINLDGTVDLSDLTAISSVLLGDININSVQKLTADVTRDGAVNLCDLARIKQYVTKDIEEF